VEETNYYPFGLAMAGISSKAAGKLENRYKYNGRELQNKEFSDGSGLELYDYGARMQDPQLGRWWTVDPMAHERVSWTPYNFCRNNPINNTDPTGALDYPIYSTSGVYLGDDGRTGGDLAFTGELDGKGGFKNLSQFTNNHTQFQTISNIVKQEGVTNDVNEYLWIAHTANNAANGSGKSLYSKLMSGFSSVPKSDKTALSISDNSTTAKFARAGVIDVMSGGADPTGGATLWDGTDFLSWGLKSPNGTPQNKFEEYKSISISGDIYNGFLNSNLSKYTSGKVRYSGTSYNIPADVFTDKANWSNGNFFYNTGEKQPYGLKATGTAGRSIFWKTEK